MKLSKKSIILYIFIAILLLFAADLILARAFSHTELDDVTPGIECSRDLMEKSDVLWVIPDFSNDSIAESKEWCTDILSLNKTLGLHGVHHTYREFAIGRDKDYIEFGISEFEGCFGFKPLLFKAPQLALSRENERMLEEQGFVVRGYWNQFFRKVYHCNDAGRFSNSFIERF